MKIRFIVEADIDGDEIPIMLFAEGRRDGTPSSKELVGELVAVKSGPWENMIHGHIRSVEIEQKTPRKTGKISRVRND